MSAGGGHLHGALDVLLAPDIGKVDIELIHTGKEISPGIDGDRRQGCASIKKIDHLPDVSHTIDLQLVDHGCFSDVCLRQDKAFEAFFTRLDCDGQSTPHRLQAPVERHFAHDHIPADPGR